MHCYRNCTTNTVLQTQCYGPIAIHDIANTVLQLQECICRTTDSVLNKQFYRYSWTDIVLQMQWDRSRARHDAINTGAQMQRHCLCVVLFHFPVKHEIKVLDIIFFLNNVGILHIHVCIQNKYFNLANF